MAQLTSEDSGDSMIKRYGLVPARLSHPNAELVLQQRVQLQTPHGVEERIFAEPLPPAAIPAWLTVISCMFLHGGWMHFLGNVWFLYVIVIIQVIVLSASVFLGIWFAIQALSGIAASARGQVAGVACWAHIGRFVAGGLVALALGRTDPCREAVTELRF